MLPPGGRQPTIRQTCQRTAFRVEPLRFFLMTHKNCHAIAVKRRQMVRAAPWVERLRNLGIIHLLGTSKNQFLPFDLVPKRIQSVLCVPCVTICVLCG